MKKIGLFVGGFFVVGIVAVLLVNYYLGAIIVQGVEKVGPTITQSTVVLDSVDFKLIKGNARIEGFVVGNPSGFTASNLFNLKDVLIDVEPKTLLEDTVVVTRVFIDSPMLTYEKVRGKSNIDQLLENVNAFLTSQKKKDDKAGKSASTEKKRLEKKIIIDDFTLRNATVMVSLLPGSKPLAIKLTDIHLTGLGRKQQGLAPAEIASEIITVITQTVKKRITENIGKFGDVTKQLNGSLDAVKKDSINTVEGLKNLKGLFNKN